MRALASYLALSWFLLPVRVDAAEQPVISQGVLDLRNCDFSRKCVHRLDGEWAFHWSRLVDPVDYHTDSPPRADFFMEVPGYWNEYSDKTRVLPKTGYASYHLCILLPSDFRREIGFNVPVFDDAFNMYLDQELVWSNGLVGKSESESRPGYRPGIVRYKPASDTLHVLFQVSNYQHRRGGFWKTLRMGSPDEIERSEDLNRMVSFMSLGMLLSFSLFFLFFFILDRKDRLMLSFSLLLAGIFIRMMFTGIYPIQYFMEMPWTWMVRLEYLGSFMAFGAALWYLYRLFPAVFHLSLTRINTLLILACGLIILAARVRVFAHTMYYLQPMVIILLVYYLWISIRAISRGDKEKVLLLFGMLILIAGLLHDILISHSRGGISQGYLLHFAIQLFVFVQAIMLILRWIRASRENRVLIREIEYVNQNLEDLVDQRTRELEKQNREIEAQSKDIEARNEELNNALAFKNKVFSIIAHDLKSPVASLVQNAALLDLKMKPGQREQVVQSFKDLSRAALALIDNLLYWGRSQGNQVKYQPSAINAGEIIDQALEPFIEMARQKSISVKREIQTQKAIYADQELLEIILRNLISNALKFTPEKGRLRILAREPDSREPILELSIEDNGIGMDHDTLQKLTSSREMISSAGTANERGTGLGLRLCQELIELNRGEMLIHSKRHQGTEVILRLPLNTQ